MKSLSGFLKFSYQKIIFFFYISGIFYIFSKYFGSLSEIKYLAKQAGAVACWLIYLLLLMSVIKTLFFELVENPETRNKANRIFEICHRSLGWAIFMFIMYHSLYYIFLYFQGVDTSISINYIITGIIATATMIIVVFTGLNKNIELKNLKLKTKSIYFNHILMTIILALLIVLHINFGGK